MAPMVTRTATTAGSASTTRESGWEPCREFQAGVAALCPRDEEHVPLQLGDKATSPEVMLFLDL